VRRSPSKTSFLPSLRPSTKSRASYRWEAAKRAGLSPKLLEEPQAAFYDWMASRTGSRPDSLVLVVDVGGGTTDLSLIRAPRTGDAIRVAVGPHLLLGGDNMDLALAHLCESRLAPQGERLAAPLFAQLTAACRAAKEKLLGHAAPDDVPVSVQARGSALVGGTLTTRPLAG
jgi:molecular chaperone DnaK (HSP70)